MKYKVSNNTWYDLQQRQTYVKPMVLQSALL